MSNGQSGIIGKIIASISPPSNKGITGRVTVLPPGIAASSGNSAQTVEGQVVQSDSNGRVRIATPQGELEVQVKSRPLPAKGTRVEVQLPKGQQSRQVNITPQQQPSSNETQQSNTTARLSQQVAARATQGAPQQNPAQNITQTPQQPAPNQTGKAPSQSQPLQNQDLVIAARETRPSAPPPQTLQPAQNVRLAPLNTVQLQQLLQSLPPQQTLQTAQTLLTPQASQQPQIILPQTSAITPTVTTNLPAVNAPQNTTIQNNFFTTIQSITPNSSTNTANNQTAPFTTTLNVPPIKTPLQTGVLFTQSVKDGVKINLAHIQSPQTPIGKTPLPNILNTQVDSIPMQTVTIKPSSQSVQQLFQSIEKTIQHPQFLLQTGSPQTIPAVVIAKTEANFPVLLLQPSGASLPQAFILQTPTTNLYPGMTVTLRVNTLTPTPAQISPTSPQAPLTAGLPLPLNDLLRPGAWPLMDDILQTLQQSAPQAAQAMSASVPNATQGNAQLTLAAFLFVAAVRSGDFSGWLGSRGIDALGRAGKSSTLNGLSNEMSSLNRGDSVINGEWRAMPIPMMSQGEIQKITLFTKYNGEHNKDNEDNNEQTRFIFDLDLTRMGAVQLDGLIQSKKRLDLVIRSQVPFSEPMRQAMRHSYTQALESVELYGELGFQGNAEGWVNVLQDDRGLFYEQH